MYHQSCQWNSFFLSFFSIFSLIPFNLTHYEEKCRVLAIETISTIIAAIWVILVLLPITRATVCAVRVELSRVPTIAICIPARLLATVTAVPTTFNLVVLTVTVTVCDPTEVSSQC